MLKYLTILLIIHVVISHDGHLKKFGSVGPFAKIAETQEHLSTKYFFENYVKTKTPLLMRGIAKEFKAFTKWSDEYFANKLEGYNNEYEVYVEKEKKETRNVAISLMKMKTFLNEYEAHDFYMISSVPEFLKPDVSLPSVLQCEDSQKTLERTLLWFSSGGTKTVTHWDIWDNILCAVNGHKKVVLVDSFRFQNLTNSIIDSEDQMYSTMDVDSVDFTKFPGIETIEYYNIDLNAGDCVFIPSKFIHQVDSFERNIAVNFWFTYDRLLNTDFLNKCFDNKFDPNLTLENLNYDNEVEWFRSVAVREIAAGNRELKSWRIILASLFQLNESDLDELELSDHVKELFDFMDFDGDGYITDEEMADVDENRFELIATVFMDFNQIVNKLLKENEIEEHNEL